MHARASVNDDTTTALLMNVLDALSIAIFVIDTRYHVVFTNKAGDAMLSEGKYVRLIAGALYEHHTIGVPSALRDAIDMISSGMDTAGIGVPLVGANGKRSAGYVLPIAGQELSDAQNQKYCAVFVAQRGGQQPMIIEILRTMFNLTSSEARIAALIAKGDGPQTIAETLGVTINTVRSHLKHAFSKTSANDQTALGALVNGLIAPITLKV